MRREELEEYERKLERARRIRMELKEAERPVEYCLHYGGGTTCELAIAKLREVADKLEEEVFPFAKRLKH